MPANGATRVLVLNYVSMARSSAGGTAFVILGAITFCHLLNDVMQALLPAIYPMLKDGFDLSFGQIGLLTLIFQVTASLLQPIVGLYTDHRPQPYSLPLGMGCSLLGLITLGFAPNFPGLLAGAALLGIGSSIFHPEFVSPCQTSLWWRAWICAISVSSWRSCRECSRAAVGCLCRSTARAR